MKLSIIIPTYNRSEVLIKCLSAFFNQDYSKSQYEIIIVNDGSTDNTEEKIKLFQKDNSQYFIRYFKQTNKGPAAARNLGVFKARGNIILFIGDDIIPAPHFLKEHDKIHRQYPNKNIAVLGYITWSQELKITPFMFWLENGGKQFSYYQLTPGGFTDYKHFYTSNISLKKLIFQKEKFNENFPYAAHEDIEFGYRLQKRIGLKIFYHPKAKAFHLHKITLKSYAHRNLKAGVARAIFNKLQPEIAKYPVESIKTKFVYNKLTIWFWMFVGQFYEKRKIKHRLFGRLCQYFYTKGFKSKIKS